MLGSWSMVSPWRAILLDNQAPGTRLPMCHLIHDVQQDPRHRPVGTLHLQQGAIPSGGHIGGPFTP